MVFLSQAQVFLIFFFASDYYHDGELRKTLLQLYTKAKSSEHLVRLTSSWSSFEASDGEYDIAMKWLIESERYGLKISQWEESNEQKWIRKNIDMIELFLLAQRSAPTNQLKTRQICEKILQNHRNGDLIQLGDCYALLIQIENDCTKAYELIEQMCKQGLLPEEYIEEETIEKIYEAIGNSWKGKRGISNNNENEYTEEENT